MEMQDFFEGTWQTSLVFFSLLAFTRLLGKTHVGQLTFYEYISGITIGSIAGTIIGSEPHELWLHYFDLVIFVVLTYLLSVITENSRPLRKILDGSPTIVIENGRILEDAMGHMRYDLDELNSQLREQGIFDPSDVQYAIMETTGKLSVIQKASTQPVTRSDLNIQSPEATLPVEIILDGTVVEEGLQKKNLTLKWLTNELAKHNLSNISDVTYAVIDSKGNLFINPKTSSPNQTDG
jgi:uncharacterized membrane protein YcaP (DUF421 family)